MFSPATGSHGDVHLSLKSDKKGLIVFGSYSEGGLGACREHTKHELVGKPFQHLTLKPIEKGNRENNEHSKTILAGFMARHLPHRTWHTILHRQLAEFKDKGLFFPGILILLGILLLIGGIIRGAARIAAQR